MALKGFFAFPSSNALVKEAIEEASRSDLLDKNKVHIKLWTEMELPGRFISTEIMNEIMNSDFLAADISVLNFNVLYEIGYAIGKGKRVIIFKNKALREGSPSLNELGIFDTLGYEDYSTSEQICAYLNKLEDISPLPIIHDLNVKTPIFYIAPKTRTDYDNYIVSAIKRAYLYFKSYDPSETNRLAGPEAIANVAKSFGVVLHFLPEDHVDSTTHNLRSAFIAGVADGMDKHRTFIQTGESPVPVDYRDFVTYCRIKSDINDAVAKLAELVHESKAMYNPSGKTRRQVSLLSKIDLGASAAENEIISLEEYYLETEAYRRAHRREIRIVTGRKGSGKTAIFFMIRDDIRHNRRNVALDLKPEGYQLLKLKDSIISLLSVGTVEHTVIAFWEYLLWLEICYKLLENDSELHKRDHDLFEPYQKLKTAYFTQDEIREGDFAERLKLLVSEIASSIESKYKDCKDIELTTSQITDIVYKHDFHNLKKIILDYLKHKNEVWLLFDNLDKGWSTHGVTKEDLIIVKTLIEATRKIEKEINKSSSIAHTIVFLRNDIYEHLIDQTSDRGKESRTNVDWDDPEMLREMIRLRIVRAFESQDTSFEEMWTNISIPIIDGFDSAQYLIDRSLMRPRSLLDLISHCRGYAMNLGHDRITKEDIYKGCKAFSYDLLTELDLEIRDVYPQAENVLYAFIGTYHKLTHNDLLNVLKSHGLNDSESADAIDILLWFGFLGIVWQTDEPKYIYSYNYNMKVMQGFYKKKLESGEISYTINPAFAPALDVTN